MSTNPPSDNLRDHALEGLWRNASDSLGHALAHFSALSSEGDSFHHRKWIVLSVHHGAEVFVNFLLSSLDPAHPKVKSRKPYYPSLRPLVAQLLRHRQWNSLAQGERRLIEEFLPPLCDSRDQLMHRPAPKVIDLSASSIALLGLLQVVRRRMGISATAWIDQSPPIEQDVVDSIDWRHLDTYTRLVEEFVEDAFPAEVIDHCPYCQGLTRTFGTDCEACFSEEAGRSVHTDAG